MCMHVQILGNFGMLHVLDMRLPGPKPLTTVTAILWSWHLLEVPAPRLCSYAAVASITFACWVAPSIVSLGAMFELYVLGVFARVLLVFYVGQAASVPLVPLALWAFSFITLQNLWVILSLQAGGLLADRAVECNLVLGVLMLLLGCRRNPVSTVVLCGCTVGRGLAVVTAQSWLLFFTAGHLGMALLVATRALTKEDATLLILQRNIDRAAKISFEWSHLVYFPVLIMHALHDILRTPPRRLDHARVKVD